ncbi:MAG: hypothetical protein ACI4TW_00220, partial [Prevotella sp.]
LHRSAGSGNDIAVIALPFHLFCIAISLKTHCDSIENVLRFHRKRNAKKALSHCHENRNKAPLP